MNRKFGLKLRRDATVEEKRAYHSTRLKLLKQDPEWVAARKKNTAEYRKKNKLLLRDRQKQWRKNNPERKKEISDTYTEKHRSRLNAQQREKNRDPERKAYIQKYAAKHRAENPDLYVTYKQNRRARDIGAEGSHTTAEWLAKVEIFDERCAYCGKKCELTRDHITPLSRGGSHSIDNILPACGSCNSAKGTLTMEEFMARIACSNAA